MTGEPKMIELTDADNIEAKHLVNLVYVQCICSKGHATRISFHNTTQFLEVQDTPSEIMDMINQGKYTVV